jgi:Arc/MetJ family transcription regulator
VLGLDAEKATPEAFALATQSAYARVSDMLGRWVGTEGSRALMERAHFEVRSQHPVLIHMQNGSLPVPSTEIIVQSTSTHGINAATEGVVSMFDAVIQLLNRLIGEDLTVILMEQCIPPDGNAPPPSKGEAT